MGTKYFGQPVEQFSIINGLFPFLFLNYNASILAGRPKTASRVGKIKNVNYEYTQMFIGYDVKC
ncbi:hypothetical protein GCM10022218_22610 [Sphingobacterium ginsenosidimutans]|uniref:Uncharacterized protein n=1 Tax=Sphingobacterium ginsenosidimutans TaxID=687845 RepID=A0ABP8A291_9SPHI